MESCCLGLLNFKKVVTILTSFIGLILFAGCKKQSIETTQPVWQQVGSLQKEGKIVLNAATNGTELFTYGPYLLNITDKELASASFFHGALSMDFAPINGNFFGYFYNQTFIFQSYKAIQSSNYGSIPLSEIDPSAKEFNTTNQSKRYKWAISDQGQVLLSVINQNGTYSVYLLTFIVEPNSGAVAARPSIKKIAIPALMLSPTSFYSIADQFFFFSSDHNTLYTVNKQGVVVATNNASDGELFYYKGMVYLVQGSQMLISKDGGLTFTNEYIFDQDLREYYFRVLEDRLFVFKPNEGIGLFEFTPTGFQIKPLDMQGLEGNLITQLTYFNQKLFVATLSGLYYKNWDAVLK